MRPALPAAALAVLSLGGCSSADAPRVAEPLPSVELSLDEAEALWRASGLTSYDFVYDQSCECANTFPHTVRVRDGQVISFTDRRGVAIPGTAPTVEWFFAEARRGFLERGRFDAARGYPVELYVDFVREVADDGLAVRIRTFTPR